MIIFQVSKLIFFNLDADVAFFNDKKHFFIIILGHVDNNLILFISAVCHVSFLHS